MGSVLVSLSNYHKLKHTWEEGISVEELPLSDWPEEMQTGYRRCPKSLNSLTTYTR